MNVPTALTLLRIILIIPLILAFEAGTIGRATGSNFWHGVAILSFLLAAGTDWLDGYLARKWQQISSLGALLDPLADKILVAAALISLSAAAIIPAWTVIVVLTREFLVSGLRIMIAESGGGVLPASWSGKAKTACQLLAIGLYLWPSDTLRYWAHATYAIAIILTFISGISYARQAVALLKS
ncbi:MAG: CDP-diacylglycerol--glycerol-3-phosphate 3-phosphatidyltransferase [Cyanobacteria bacterium NC_groundwater_1444_Ag_S-0.65um_54_12]|nr:CDP-diacylglycerol--glycerol-3-phosphate 3-phosphatidyltransferase [Cyanobacteria bacterium NC_groundwater_1444_Ag_S-0.65um_54_12]